MNLNLLRKLYTTHSPSANEEEMAAVVKDELTTMNLSFEEDKLLQIWHINKGKPLIVAHMDQVQKTKCDKVMSFKNRLYGFSKKGKLSGLGADDKNGVFILLTMLKMFRDDLSFIFSTREEIGGALRYVLDEVDLTHTPYALVFDRKGRDNIIGTANSYCCDDLETAIEVISGKLKYRAAEGIFSDCDDLSLEVPCVNLSCGYYNAHTEEEYTKLAELHRALQLAETLLGNLPRKNNPFELPMSFERAGKFEIDEIDNYSSYGNSWYWNGKSFKKDNTKTTSIQKKTSAKQELDVYDTYLSNFSLLADDEEITLQRPDGTDERLGETMFECLGFWEVEAGQLEIEITAEGDDGIPIYSASIDGIEISIEDFRSDAIKQQEKLEIE